MSQTPHYSHHEDLTDALLAFTQLAREGGLNVGIEEMIQSKRAALAGMIREPSTFYYSLKGIFCTNEEDIKVFNSLYYMFWQDNSGRAKEEQEAAPKARNKKRNTGSMVVLGAGNALEGEEDSHNTSGASAQERLQETDFSKVSSIDAQMLEELAERLLKQMSMRLKRKMKTHPRKGAIDVRKTIRQNMSRGGEPMVLARRSRKPRKQRLILLLDVSGSMDKYSFFLLRFICVLQAHFEFVEAFIFSTSLIRITDSIQSPNLQENLKRLSRQADNWSSGTKIGECLRYFNENYAKRLLNGSSTVIVLSDGLDTGEPLVLAREAKKIRLRTRQLVWLNPLKGNPNFQPIQRGMQAALPEIDVFRSAHNLRSLLELESFLASVI
ncbi:MAG: VWA domain-containing protein [Bacteroidia bacterium]|nr:VWA domain-containing protein [Bacteroidia bacterium]